MTTWTCQACGRRQQSDGDVARTCITRMQCEDPGCAAQCYVRVTRAEDGTISIRPLGAAERVPSARQQSLGANHAPRPGSVAERGATGIVIPTREGR